MKVIPAETAQENVRKHRDDYDARKDSINQDTINKILDIINTEIIHRSKRGQLSYNFVPKNYYNDMRFSEEQKSFLMNHSTLEQIVELFKEAGYRAWLERPDYSLSVQWFLLADGTHVLSDDSDAT